MTEASIGKVLALYISEKGKSSRIHQEKIICNINGILHDKFYEKDLSRSILITSQESYRLLQDKGIEVAYGLLGENILTDFNPYHLPHKTKLKIGNAILEITQNCTICNHLSVIDKRVPALLKEDRGIFAKVIQNGTIQRGDSVEKLK